MSAFAPPRLITFPARISEYHGRTTLEVDGSGSGGAEIRHITMTLAGARELRDLLGAVLNRVDHFREPT
jgi:hypothetical protein